MLFDELKESRMRRLLKYKKLSNTGLLGLIFFTSFVMVACSSSLPKQSNVQSYAN